MLTGDIQYHIKCRKGDVARYVLLPGDPARVKVIASLWDESRKVAENRQYVTYTGKAGGVDVSTTSTGIGGPSAGIAVEELARCGALSPVLQYAAGGLVAMLGRESVKSKWLPALARGEILIGLASTEPHAGSDAAAMRTTAVRALEGYVLNGEKQMVTAPMEAAAFVVFAKTQPEAGARGVSAFFVPMDSQGLQRNRFPTMGPRTTSFGGFVMKDVRVPLENLLGQENEGFVALMKTFDYLRVLIALYCIGLAEGSLEETLQFVKQRKAFGQPIGKFESVQFRIAEDSTLLEAARLLCYKALWLISRGEKSTRESAMAKWWSPIVAFNAINNCIQNHGAVGFTSETLDELRLRDVRGMWFADGTADIMKIVIGREMLGKEFVPYR
jgi:cyclohexanecarboxyl-CoA dehydrogenase